MIINGIDIEKHLNSRFSGAIAGDKIVRCVLFFDNSSDMRLIATRVYGGVPSKNGSIVSIFNWESDSKICLFEFSLKTRIENVKSLQNYKNSIIVTKTQKDWSASGDVGVYDFKRIRPNRELVSEVLQGMRGGNIYGPNSCLI